MSIERRSCVSQAPHVTKRLLAIIVLLTGLLCMFGGYLLGRMARPVPSKSMSLLTYNLSIIADSTYKKAKRIPPKLIHQNDPDKIQLRLLELFNCTQPCGGLNKYNLAEFVKNSINYQVNKLMRAVNNASLYLDSLS
ncbi:hypothetical protein PYW07_007663 [Mythimna separata]|uniref:Uncharacterized protein n=1 Tax=Mythimna separata TaxID=271217 RepID=A0AAD7YQU1_MYTSE|nr:hypothetical protein PYW07_007663 [Mythimna separata]